MSSTKTQFKAILHVLTPMLLFTTMAAAQIPGLCNTGQTAATSAGCAGALVPLANALFTPHLDGNWEVGFPWPNTVGIDTNDSPCAQERFISTTVENPAGAWLPNSASPASQWTTPDGGSYLVPRGFYIFRTQFPVPSVLPGGGVPTGVTINGQLASDNQALWIYLENPAGNANCSLVSGQQFPVNDGNTFEQWWPFSFTNSLPIKAGAEAYLYFVVRNGDSIYDSSAAGLRVEFFPSSTFN